ncbi:uncharacterized protein V1513DRAFT_401255 [Lipomyces chichibuensis]|uniref:uncharacterized protein n=1 Tax=Lipomyces chichibuensis TaxID=1546026 RepID=UPI0033436593
MNAADTARTKTTCTANTPPSDDETVETGIRILRDMLAAVRVCNPDNSDERDTCSLRKVQSEDSYKDNTKLSFEPDFTDRRCPTTTRAVKKLMYKMHRRNANGSELDVLTATSTNTTSMTGVTLTNSIVEKMKTLRICPSKEDLEKQSSEPDKPTVECNRLTFAQRLRALVPKMPRHELNVKSEHTDRSHHTKKCKKHFFVATLHHKVQTCVDKVNRGGVAVLAMTSTLSSTALTGNLTQKMDEVKIKVEPDAPVFASNFTTPAPAPVPPPASPSHWPYPSAATVSIAKRLSAEPQDAQDISEVTNNHLNSRYIVSDRTDYNHDEDGEEGPVLEPKLSPVDKAAEGVSDDEIDMDEFGKFFEEQEEIGNLCYLNFDEDLASTSSSFPSTQEVPTAAKETAADLEWAPLRPLAVEGVTAPTTNRYTTSFAQQVLIHHRFQGPLDSVEALNVFNNLMRSGVPLFGPPVSLSATSATAVTEDAVTTTAPLVTVAAGKPAVIHIPTFAASATTVATNSSAFVLHERPPSPPLEPVNSHDSELIADFGLAGPSTVTARISGPRASSVPDSVDPLVQRFMAIGGIERLFPGLATDWNFAGRMQESSPNFDHQMTNSVHGINYIPTSPNDPMSIARLTNPNPPSESAGSSSYAATTMSSSAGSTPTSLSSGSNGYSTNGSGLSSINSLLLGAATFAAGYPGDLQRYRRRSSTTSTGSRSHEAEDEDEEVNNSASSNTDHGPNYTTTSNSSIASGPLPWWHGPRVDAVSVPPSPNYHPHQSLQYHQNLAHQQQPFLPGVGGPQRIRSRKQQCPECNGWYSNLSAHCSTHLSYASRPHSCTVCGRGFSRPNDLLRHQKSHQGDAPFYCPYHATDRRCHPSGGFSRCDTYKNHLKSMHFDYPAGTKKKERQGAGGKCGACLMEFQNVDEWISAHVESGRCKFLQ